MGTRNIDARNSKRSSQRKTPLGTSNHPTIMQQQQLQQPVVGALEVKNVRQAINRYGTLPKSSRIGAYLDSLRQNGENESPIVEGLIQPVTAQQISGNVLGIPTTNDQMLPSTHSPRTALKVQPQMIRSNSSGGVTMTNSATASLTKLQRHRTTTDGTMMTTFSSFRSAGSTNSPKRNLPPALADLEFPPPPPPGKIKLIFIKILQFNNFLIILEEFDGINNQFHQDIPSGMKQPKMSNDVSNTAPSVEEASTRFGVSLRKREPSTDSCSSLGSPANDLNDVIKSIDPAAMLVSELAETMIPKPDAPMKPSELARKPSTPKPTQNQNESNGIPQFKAQLKKVEPKSRPIQEPPKNEITTSIIDFKSRLRRVDGPAADENSSEMSDKVKSDNKIISDDSTNSKVKPNNNNNTLNGKDTPLKKTEIKIEVVESKNGSPESKQAHLSGSSDDDDKRKSTGSISSLKKLWEAKEHQPIVAGEQLSPKSIKKDDDSHNNNGHHEPSMDPPVAKKPAVPVKPSKFTIYATPIQNTQPKLDGKLGENNNHTISTAAPSSRDSILELVQLVECNLKIPVNLISATQWLQLSDKLNIIRSSCVTYADTETMPPHTKFQFRELVTRVENQSNCLRSAGQKNVQDNEKLLVEVGQSLKQLSNALHR
jgi:abelson tyrosine-protein kinase 1